MPYIDEYFRIAYEIAEKGRGRCGINPFVGAVLVKNDRIIGQGFTQTCGQDHAEIQALNSATESTEDAELYVTLEPCAHHGRTPPCTEAIIRAGIKSVYAGIVDPNPLVNGKGLARLREAGIVVSIGYWQDKIERQLEYYLLNCKKSRPFFLMKTAVSLDGKTAAENGESKWITSLESRSRGHLLRLEAGAVLTGIETVLKDNPMLNVRLEENQFPVLRLVLDSRLRIPLESNIVRTAATIPTIVFKAENHHNADKENKLLKEGVAIESLPTDGNKLLSLDILSERLYRKGISTVLIEAGAKLSSSFLKAGLVDKLYYFVAPKVIGNGTGVFSHLGITGLNQAIEVNFDTIERIGDDFLLICYPKLKSNN